MMEYLSTLQSYCLKTRSEHLPILIGKHAQETILNSSVPPALIRNRYIHGRAFLGERLIVGRKLNHSFSCCNIVRHRTLKNLIY